MYSHQSSGPTTLPMAIEELKRPISDVAPSGIYVCGTATLTRRQEVVFHLVANRSEKKPAQGPKVGSALARATYDTPPHHGNVARVLVSMLGLAQRLRKYSSTPLAYAGGASISVGRATHATRSLLGAFR